MYIEPKYTAQDEGVSLFYLAKDRKTGLEAMGGTHMQAISNLLGVLFLS